MKQHFLIAALITTFSFPLFSFAATYTPLVGIPGVDPAADFNTYINSLYALSISIAALLAVIKIIIAGVKWMMTDVVTTKGEAKKDIQGALIGLIIVIAAVLILNQINEDITNVNLKFESPVSPTASPVVTTAPPPLPAGYVLTLTPTAKLTYWTQAHNLTSEQVQTIINNCNKTPNSRAELPTDSSGTTYPRCLTFSSTEYSKMYRNCLPGDCSTPTQNVLDNCEKVLKGSYKVDLVLTSYGYCTYPD